MEITELASYLLGRLDEWERGIERGATVAVVGSQGSGKSTYAYYSIKQAYIMWRCRQEVKAKRGSNYETCIRRAFKETCWGTECVEPDDVDKELREHIYVSIDDIKRLIERLAKREEPAPFVFVDDLGVSSLAYFDKRLRPLYLAFQRFEEWRRSVAVNLVLTTVYEKRLARALRDSAIMVYASYHQVYQLSEGEKLYRVYRYVGVKKVLQLTREGYHQARFVALWEDIIPFNREWAMPPWLSKLIDERKRELLMDTARRLS